MARVRDHALPHVRACHPAHAAKEAPVIGVVAQHRGFTPVGRSSPGHTSLLEKLTSPAPPNRAAQSLALDVRDRFAWDIPPELTDVSTKLDPLFYNP